MKVWVMAILEGGNLTDLLVFSSQEKAYNRFEKIAEVTYSAYSALREESEMPFGEALSIASRHPKIHDINVEKFECHIWAAEIDVWGANKEDV